MCVGSICMQYNRYCLFLILSIPSDYTWIYKGKTSLSSQMCYFNDIPNQLIFPISSQIHWKLDNICCLSTAKYMRKGIDVSLHGRTTYVVIKTDKIENNNLSCYKNEAFDHFYFIIFAVHWLIFLVGSPSIGWIQSFVAQTCVDCCRICLDSLASWELCYVEDMAWWL